MGDDACVPVLPCGGDGVLGAVVPAGLKRAKARHSALPRLLSQVYTVAERNELLHRRVAYIADVLITPERLMAYVMILTPEGLAHEPNHADAARGLIVSVALVATTAASRAFVASRQLVLMMPIPEILVRDNCSRAIQSCRVALLFFFRLLEVAGCAISMDGVYDLMLAANRAMPGQMLAFATASTIPFQLLEEIENVFIDYPDMRVNDLFDALLDATVGPAGRSHLSPAEVLWSIAAHNGPADTVKLYANFCVVDDVWDGLLQYNTNSFLSAVRTAIDALYAGVNV